MTGRSVYGELAIVVSGDEMLKIVDRDRKKAASVEAIADAIHKSFCETRGFRGIAGDVHRAMHLSIAQTIFDELPG